MNKKAKRQVEFRYYEIPCNEPALALLGHSWVRRYGFDVDYDHFHNLLEVGYCYWGTGVLTIEEEKISYCKESITLIPKNIPHDTLSDGDVENKWEYLFIDVAQIFNEKFTENTGFAQEMIRTVNKSGWIRTVEEEPVMSGIILSILDVMRERKPYYIETARELVCSLLLQAARMQKEMDQFHTENFNRNNCTSVSNALDYISDYYYKPIKIQELAEICHVSEAHFRRIFKESMHIQPMDYLNLVRVQMACEFMLHTNLSMEMIGEKAGFSTPSTFSRNFRKLLGTSPYQWKSHPDSYEGKLKNYKISVLKGW